MKKKHCNKKHVNCSCLTCEKKEHWCRPCSICKTEGDRESSCHHTNKDHPSNDIEWFRNRFGDETTEGN